MQNLFVLAGLLSITTSLYSQYIMTVQGKIPASEMKSVLPHEHVMTNFIGAKDIKIPVILNKGHITPLLPHFEQLKKEGINTIFECTPAFLGRDVEFLRELSMAANIHIVTNTGYYAAMDKKYLPQIFYQSDATAISKILIDEFENGIEGTGIRPGFIKIGFGKGPMDSIEQKLMYAAILTSKKTGLVIGSHTGDFASSLSQYKLMVHENLNPSRLIWIHSQNASNEERKMMAEKGCWISLDGVSENNVDEYVESVLYMKQHNLLDRLLISHDDGWSVLSNGSYYKIETFKKNSNLLYTTIPQKLLPMLLKRGMTEQEIQLVMTTNPSRCFALSNPTH
jgi:phosphotriesterase-related protein